MQKKTELIIDAKESQIGLAVEFISDYLNELKISPNKLHEYRLLSEEILLKLTQNAPKKAKITVTIGSFAGTSNISITCPGAPVDLFSEEDYGSRILSYFSDYISQSYRRKINKIILSTGTTSNLTFFRCLTMMLLGAALGTILHLILNPSQIAVLCTSLLFPIVSAFIRIIQAVSLPVVFVSLASTIITCCMKIRSERRLTEIILDYAFTSVIAVLIGILLGSLSVSFFDGVQNEMTFFNETPIQYSAGNLSEFLLDSIPGNIIEPFTSSNPVPLLVMAVIFGFGAVSVFGSAGDDIRRAFKSTNTFNYTLLNMVYSVLPYLVFVAAADLTVYAGPKAIPHCLLMAALMISGLLLQIVFYAIQAAFAGISPVNLFYENRDIILENLRIGSNIDALYYNFRSLKKKVKMSNDDLMDTLQLGSVMSMDGNCVVVSLGIILFTYFCGSIINPLQYAELFITILFLSIGAPNLPGSFLISIAVLTSNIGIFDELLPVFILVEAIIGKPYSFVNAFGDIVQVLIKDKKARDLQQKQPPKNEGASTVTLQKKI